MQGVTPVFWFDGDAVEAARLWTSVIPNYRIITDIPYPEDGDKGEPGTVMVVEFELDGRRYAGLNGGPYVTSSTTSRMEAGAVAA